MKTRYALALASMMLIPAAWAVDAPAPTPPPQAVGMPMPGGMMDDEGDVNRINLTATQKTQIQAIHADAKARHEAIRTETHAKVRALLTPEQQKIFDENQTMRMGKHMEKKEMRREKMKEHMNKPY